MSLHRPSGNVVNRVNNNKYHPSIDAPQELDKGWYTLNDVPQLNGTGSNSLSYKPHPQKSTMMEEATNKGGANDKRLPLDEAPPQEPAKKKARTSLAIPSSQVMTKKKKKMEMTARKIEETLESADNIKAAKLSYEDEKDCSLDPSVLSEAKILAEDAETKLEAVESDLSQLLEDSDSDSDDGSVGSSSVGDASMTTQPDFSQPVKHPTTPNPHQGLTHDDEWRVEKVSEITNAHYRVKNNRGGLLSDRERRRLQIQLEIEEELDRKFPLPSKKKKMKTPDPEVQALDEAALVKSIEDVRTDLSTDVEVQPPPTMKEKKSDDVAGGAVAALLDRQEFVDVLDKNVGGDTERRKMASRHLCAYCSCRINTLPNNKLPTPIPSDVKVC